MKHPPRGSQVSQWQHLVTTLSTNDDALAWAAEGAPDMALVSADHQSAGRGRGDHTWLTYPGTGLAFSLIIRPTKHEAEHLTRLPAMAGLALVRVLDRDYGIQSDIKWPNDVLINGRKVAGILVETTWEEEAPLVAVIGMGVNILPAAIPSQEKLRFPATCLGLETDKPLDGQSLMFKITREIYRLRKKLHTNWLIRQVNRSLAYRNTSVCLHTPSGKPRKVHLLGIDGQGQLLVRTEQQLSEAISAGELEITYNDVV